MHFHDDQQFVQSFSKKMLCLKTFQHVCCLNCAWIFWQIFLFMKTFLLRFSLVILDSKIFWASQIHVKSHERKSVGGTIEIMCDRGNCGKTFRRQSELIDHLNLHDNFLQKCYFCPWGAPPGQTNSIKTHLTQHIGQANMKCSYCDKRFFRKKHLDAHIEVRHEIVPDKYRCKNCGMKTHSRGYLHKHKCSNK